MSFDAAYTVSPFFKYFNSPMLQQIYQTLTVGIATNGELNLKDIGVIRQRLEENKVSEEFATSQEHSLLDLAAADGNINLIKLLIDIKFEKFPHKLHSPIHFATCNGHLEALQVLLDRGKYDIDQKSLNCMDILDLAIIYRRESIIAWLINEQKIQQGAALAHAVTVQDAKTIHLLHQLNYNYQGDHPLIYLAAERNAKISLQTLIELDHYDINAKTKNGSTALHAALENAANLQAVIPNEAIDLVKILLAEDCYVDYRAKELACKLKNSAARSQILRVLNNKLSYTFHLNCLYVCLSISAAVLAAGVITIMLNAVTVGALLAGLSYISGGMSIVVYGLFGRSKDSLAIDRNEIRLESQLNPNFN